MSGTTTYYDQIASIVPGSLVIVLVGWITGRAPPSEWLDTGSSGVAIIGLGGLAVGFLLSQLGTRLSPVLWKITGRPTNRCKDSNDGLLPKHLVDRIVADARGRLHVKGDIDDKSWQGYVRYCIARLGRTGNTNRLDLFLAQFAMARNLLLVSIPLSIYAGAIHDWFWLGVGVVGVVGTWMAMRFFDERCATELFVAYLESLDAKASD